MKRCGAVMLLVLLGAQIVWGQSISTGKGQVMEVSSELRAGTTFVQLRQLGELLGLEVKWIGEENAVELQDVSNVMKVYVGKTEGSFNEEPFNERVGPILSGNKVYLPLRVVAEHFGYEVSYENKTVVCVRKLEKDDYMEVEVMKGLLDKQMNQLMLIQKNNWKAEDLERERILMGEETMPLFTGISSQGEASSSTRVISDQIGSILTNINNLYYQADFRRANIPQEVKEEQMKEVEARYKQIYTNYQKIINQLQQIEMINNKVIIEKLDMPEDAEMLINIVESVFYKFCVERYKSDEEYYGKGELKKYELIRSIPMIRQYRDNISSILIDTTSTNISEKLAQYLIEIDCILEKYQTLMLE